MDNLFNGNINRKNSNVIKWDRQKSEDSLPFWIADSDYPTAPVVLDEINRVASIGAYGYNYIPDEFKDAVTKWYKKRYNSNVDKEWVVPTSGVILEIRLLLDLLTKKGDEVIIQTPVYHCFHQVITYPGRKIVENKLIKKNDTYEMDYENLENLFSGGCKVMILCSPHNPVGRVWKKEEVEKVISLAKKYNVFVIIDEIHSDLIVGDRKFVSGADFINEYKNIAICNAPSKTFNLAGLCTAYTIIPDEDLRERFNLLVKNEFLPSPTVFGYSATIKAYNEGDEWADKQNEHLKKNYLYLKEYINKELPCVVVTKLEGTYLVWLDMSYTGLNSEKLLEKCSEYKVTVSGGVGFGKDYESYLRINIACPFSQLKEGLERLVKAFK